MTIDPLVTNKVASTIDIESLLANTRSLAQKMHYIIDDFNLKPANSHIGTCINYSDLLPMSEDFVRELIATVLRFVYSLDEQKRIRGELSVDRDEDNAFQILVMKAQDKFRKNQIKGQFSELLIFNLLQHHFRAAPLLRKMRLTTNPNLERNGADAIHIAKENDKYILYIAECKTYNRQRYAFRDAFKDAIKDIVLHYHDHRNELYLYNYEDFIPDELRTLATDYQEGRIDNVEVRLVCMVSYNDQSCANGTCRSEILNEAINSIRNEIALLPNNFFADIPAILQPRLYYILFPIKEMDKILESFNRRLG